jgi:kumamolisin
MVRFLLRWAAVAIAASLVSACSGGMPHTSSPMGGSAGTGTASEAVGVVTPQALGAPVGVRSVVHLPLRNAAALEALVAQQSTQGSSQYHHFLTPTQFANEYAPTAASLKAAAATLTGMGFQTHVTTQSVIADAPQSTVEHAFGVKLVAKTSNGRSVLSADRAVTLPQALRTLSASVIVSPKFIPHVDSVRVPVPANRYGGWSAYWFDDLKQAYSYPSYQRIDGAGRTIGIVMANAPLQSDVDLYFNNENYTAITGRPVPHFTLENVDGGAPFDPNLSAEVDLDVQESLGSAPGVREIVYDTPDLSFGSLYDAYTQVVDENRADIVNSSLGLGELFFTPPYWGDATGIPLVEQTFHDLFLQGTAQGQTFLASSGDLGAKECPSLSADETTLISPMLYCSSWPADDPLVTGVGGTNLDTTALPAPDKLGYPYPYALTSAYVAENANNDPLAVDIEYTGGPAFTGEVWGSGGGVSIFFSEPFYQRLVPNVIGRGRNSPDIAMHMGGCPEGAVLPCNPDRSFDLIYLGGELAGLIGTSCSSPEFAGLLAITEQNLGTRLGNANYYIYALDAASGDTFFHHRDIPGDSGGWTTANGYDRVLGVGTPYGNLVSGVFGPLAGNPQTPSNP